MTPIDQPVPDEVRTLAARFASGLYHGSGQALIRDSIAAAIMADRSRPSMSGMRVKGLEWSQWDAETDVCRAKSVVGEYLVTLSLDDISGEVWGLFFRGTQELGLFATEDAAKSAAEAHNANLILSALITPDPAASADEAEANAPALPSQPEGEVGDAQFVEVPSIGDAYKVRIERGEAIAILTSIMEQGWEPKAEAAFVIAIAALRAQPKGEAVAYWHNGVGQVLSDKAKRTAALDDEVYSSRFSEPLYAHPAPAAAEVDKLREALADARAAIAGLDKWSLGEGGRGDPDNPIEIWPLRDELLREIDNALKGGAA